MRRALGLRWARDGHTVLFGSRSSEGRVRSRSDSRLCIGRRSIHVLPNMEDAGSRPHGGAAGLIEG
jgi:hypothetical protein